MSVLGGEAYCLVVSLYEKEFVVECNGRIADGWVPSGGVQVDKRGNMYQAFVLSSVDNNV